MFLLSLFARFIRAIKLFRTALADTNYAFMVADEQVIEEDLKLTASGSNKFEEEKDEELSLTCQWQSRRYLANGQLLNDKSIREWRSLKDTEKSQRNLEHLRKNILSWDTLVDQKVQLGVNGYYYVFLHVPKAGGTTLKDIIAKNYPPQHCIHSHAPETIKNAAMLFRWGKSIPLNVIMGHQHLSSLLYQLLVERPIIHFTMLREPAKRIISHYNFIKRGSSPSREKIRDLAFEDYIQLDIAEVNNGQAMRLLGLRGKSGVEYLNTRDRAEVIADLHEVLEQSFTFFGLLEKFDEFIIMASKLLGWSEIFYTRRNVSDSSQRVSFNNLSKETISLIYEKNWLDIELYRFAQELFQQRCEAMGITDQVLGTYRQLTQDYRHLMAASVFEEFEENL
ncbi:MAG: sulfotransferase family protein [Cyanothece sp. SIO2G6]|nr:sulfotransferase family protein [Cyanothece sp. SIO2G6]